MAFIFLSGGTQQLPVFSTAFVRVCGSLHKQSSGATGADSEIEEERVFNSLYGYISVS